MVADKVVVPLSARVVRRRRPNSWRRQPQQTIARPQRGTTITLHLKDDAGEFAERFRINGLIKRYSDYVTYPVRMPKAPEVDEEGNEKLADGEWNS